MFLLTLPPKVFFPGAKLFNLLQRLAIHVTTHGEFKYTFEIFFRSPPERERASGPGLSIIEENRGK